MKVLLVYNPRADHGKAEKMIPQVKDKFAQEKVNVELVLTEYPGHATEIVSRVDFDLYDGIVAAGGDGTVFEVINGVYQNESPKKIPLGILPKGTGNAFARDLDLYGSEWEKAIKIISEGNVRKVDVGHFKTRNKDYYFLNILGFGFVADVVETAVRLKFFGNVSYTFGVLYQTIFLKSHRLTAEIDGKILERENVFVEISNTRWASNFLMAPDAVINDGLLDVTLANGLTRRRLLKVFPKVFTGEHILEPEIETFKAKKIRIETDVPKTLTPDGELVGKTPCVVDCLHQDMEVFWT